MIRRLRWGRLLPGQKEKGGRGGGENQDAYGAHQRRKKRSWGKALPAQGLRGVRLLHALQGPRPHSVPQSALPHSGLAVWWQLLRHLPALPCCPLQASAVGLAWLYALPRYTFRLSKDLAALYIVASLIAIVWSERIQAKAQQKASDDKKRSALISNIS